MEDWVLLKTRGSEGLRVRYHALTNLYYNTESMLTLSRNATMRRSFPTGAIWKQPAVAQHQRELYVSLTRTYQATVLLIQTCSARTFTNQHHALAVIRATWAVTHHL
jgi:hypothetical protein